VPGGVWPCGWPANLPRPCPGSFTGLRLVVKMHPPGCSRWSALRRQHSRVGGNGADHGDRVPRRGRPLVRVPAVRGHPRPSPRHERGCRSGRRDHLPRDPVHRGEGHQPPARAGTAAALPARSWSCRGRRRARRTGRRPGVASPRSTRGSPTGAATSFTSCRLGSSETLDPVIGQAGSSLMSDGSCGSMPLKRCRKSLDAGYAARRERMIEPSGRWASRACQGLKERTSWAWRRRASL